MVVQRTGDIYILKHFLIRDESRYARDMNLLDVTATYCAQAITQMVFDIQENMANCKTNVIRPLNPFEFLFHFGGIIRHAEAGITDAYLVRVTEDMYRRMKMALYNEPAPDFNDTTRLGNSSVPWAIADINLYACKWGIDINTATDICNWLIGVYEAAKVTAGVVPMEFFPFAHADLADALRDFGGMSALRMSQLAEDVYARFRYIVLQSCALTTNPTNQLDCQAQLLMFYEEQKKMHLMSTQCMSG